MEIVSLDVLNFRVIEKHSKPNLFAFSCCIAVPVFINCTGTWLTQTLKGKKFVPAGSLIYSFTKCNASKIL